MRTTAVVLAWMICGAPLAAEDWPQFRGPGGRAVSDEAVPVRWTTTENVRWKADLPGRGVSGPVTAGGRVYVTAASGYRDRRLHVLCFDQANGKKLWERQLASTGSTMRHDMTSMAGPTPVTDGKTVWALFATGDLAAFDRDGNLLWYRSLCGDYPNITNQVGMAASPILVGDTLLLPLENTGDSFAAGLDARTGANRWRAGRHRDINWVTPVAAQVGGQEAVLFQTGADLTAFEPHTGKVLWSYTGGDTSSVPSPIAAHSLIYVAARQFTALRPGPARTAPEVVWRTGQMNLNYASPVYYKDRIYGLIRVGVNCVDAATGELVWKERINGTFWASPVIADGKLYVVTEDGTTTVIQLGDKPKVLARNALGEQVLATPAVSGGALFLRSHEHLYCIAERGK